MSISINSIKTTLGETTNSLGALCTSNRVNKWSVHKPVTYNKIGQLTDDELYSTDCGLDIPILTGARIVDMINIYENTLITRWGYATPNAPYRMADFLSYDHYADEWFTLDWVTTSTADVGHTIRLETNTDFQWFVNNMGSIKNANYKNDLDVCLLIKRTDRNNYYVYKAYNIQDASDSSIVNINMPSLDGEGQYIVYPFLTDGTKTWNNNTCQGASHVTYNSAFILLPAYSNVRMTQSSTGGDHWNNYVELDFHRATYNLNLNNMTISNISLMGEIYLNGITTGNWNVSVTIQLPYPPAGTGTTIGSFSRTLNSTVSADIFNTNYYQTISLINEGNLDERIPVRITMTIVHNNVTQTTTWNETIERY